MITLKNIWELSKVPQHRVRDPEALAQRQRLRAQLRTQVRRVALQVGDLRAEKYLVVLEKYLKLDVVGVSSTWAPDRR